MAMDGDRYDAMVVLDIDFTLAHTYACGGSSCMHEREHCGEAPIFLDGKNTHIHIRPGTRDLFSWMKSMNYGTIIFTAGSSRYAAKVASMIEGASDALILDRTHMTEPNKKWSDISALVGYDVLDPSGCPIVAVDDMRNNFADADPVHCILVEPYCIAEVDGMEWVEPRVSWPSLRTVIEDRVRSINRMRANSCDR